MCVQFFVCGFSLSTSQPHSDMLVCMYSLALYLLVLPCQLCLATALGPHSGRLDISPKQNPLVPSVRNWYRGVLRPGEFLNHRAGGT